MAPILKILVEWLPSLPTTLRSAGHVTTIDSLTKFDEFNQQQSRQQPFDRIQVDHSDAFTLHTGGATNQATISSISSAKDRLDVFVVEDRNLTHKFWDGHQWNPSGGKMETLGHGFVTPPTAITWGVNRQDIFGLNEDNIIVHQYWDGEDWRPSPGEVEELSAQCDPGYSVAATTWGVGRLDIFCRGLGTQLLLHQYFDGTTWSRVEYFKYYVQQEPTVVSWAQDRLDVFFINGDSEITHLFWDGYQWRDESGIFKAPQGYKWDTLTTTTWDVDRLDLFAAGPDSGLWHMYWEGSRWVQWESLSASDDKPVGEISVNSWSANRFDIVIKSREENYYYYKFYDGNSWQPSTEGWYGKSQVEFDSKPSLTSWGENRLDIFGVVSTGTLLHQAWTGSSWYPRATNWEVLNREPVLPGSSDRQTGEDRWPTTERKLPCGLGTQHY
ncbi:MAG: hypothetical protein Q9170_002227 [Blastenia crenularia]